MKNKYILHEWERVPPKGGGRGAGTSGGGGGSRSKKTKKQEPSKPKEQEDTSREERIKAAEAAREAAEERAKAAEERAKAAEAAAKQAVEDSKPATSDRNAQAKAAESDRRASEAAQNQTSPSGPAPDRINSTAVVYAIDLTRETYQQTASLVSDREKWMELPYKYVTFLIVKKSFSPSDAVRKLKEVFGQRGELYDNINPTGPIPPLGRGEEFRNKQQDFQRKVEASVSANIGEIYAIDFRKYTEFYEKITPKKESKIHKHYFIDPIKNRHNQVEKLVFERLVKNASRL